MKTFIFTLASALFLSVGVQAQELVKDGQFDSADLSVAYKVAGNKTIGVWCVNNDEAPGVADIQLVKDKDKERGNAVKFSCDPKLSTWYKAFVSQRYEGAVQPGMYRLGFWAKSNDGGQVKAFIRLADDKRVFLCTAKQPKSGDRAFYGGYGDVNPSSKWAYYTLDFNFGKVTNNLYQFKMTDTVDATPDDLKDFALCLQNSASEPSTILIDGISLTKIEQ